MRRFTPEQATRTLPLVRRIVEDVQSAYRRYEAARESLAAAPRGDAAARDRLQGACDEAAQELADLARELEAVGCEVKDPAIGLVDFPGEIEGEEALLCWLAGEPEVAFWHTREAGFAGRRPIPAPARR
ncbi:MAG: DUF2203 domain-containing protein [Planctomycetales bacterium]|nr:DUF2203 domain-containing protein [Planctomycetales bacterium]